MRWNCTWTEDTIFDGFILYTTGCDNEFMFSEGGVEENHYEYCPFCGYEITVDKKEETNNNIVGC